LTFDKSKVAMAPIKLIIDTDPGVGKSSNFTSGCLGNLAFFAKE
jgi:hypothetical protein